MKEVLLSYLQFLIWQITENGLLFVATILAVPAVWLILRITNLLYEEKALNLATVTFAGCSILATVLFVTTPNPMDFYKPLLLLTIGLLSHIWAPIIYCETPSIELDARRKLFHLDGITVPVANVTQVSVNRCFTRTKRSCLMEIFVSDQNSRGRSLYFETNDVNKFREVINFFKKYVNIDYDCSFTQSTIEIPFFTLAVNTVLLSLFIFTLLLPASQSLNEKRVKMSLPEYKTVVVPKDLYEVENLNSGSDIMSTIFSTQNPQIIVFDAGHSTRFLGNYRKALNSYPDQNFDFNIIYVRKNGMSLKHAFKAKELIQKSPENKYTAFITKNCQKLCYLDNDIKMLYRTDIETVDPRVSNVQDAVNMLNHIKTKRIEQKRIEQRRLESRRKRGEDTEN